MKAVTCDAEVAAVRLVTTSASRQRRRWHFDPINITSREDLLLLAASASAGKVGDATAAYPYVESGHGRRPEDD